MNKHVMSIARRKVSDFIRLEDGTVGNRSAFTTAALVAASSLAVVLLTPQIAHAEGYCPDGVFTPKTYCCWDGPNWNHSDNWGPNCILAQ